MEVSYDYFTPALTDCWRIILEQITEPEDLESLILTCPLFGEMLYTRKISELFLPVLLRKTALPRDTLLSLRILNKGTRHTVDTFLSDLPYDYYWLHEASYLPPDRPDRLERFRTVFAPQILTGSLISSRLRIGAQRDRLLEPMTIFLQPISHLIKNLHVELYCSEEEYPAYPHLFRLLSQLPMISSLSLQFDTWSPANQLASFPPLRFLKELKLRSVGGFRIHDDKKRLIELLIQAYGSELQHVSFRFYPGVHYNLSYSELSKLECLEIGDFRSGSGLFYHLAKIQLPSLKKLVFSGDSLEISSFFLDALSHLWNTLEDLQIRAELDISDFKMSFANDPSLWMRALPKLRRVVAEAGDWDSAFWLLFRVWFSNMEELTFEKKDFSLDDDDDNDDFNGPCPQRLREMLGKYFQLFPNLKQVVYVGLEEKCGSEAREQFVIRRPKSLQN